MSTAVIRKKLHNYLEVAKDKKVKAIYTLLEAEIEASRVKYTRRMEAELDKRYAAYMNKDLISPAEEGTSKGKQQLVKSAKK